MAYSLIATNHSHGDLNDNKLSGYASHYQGFGQSFTGDGKYLGSMTYRIRKVFSPTGNAVCKIYAHSGTFGTSSVPTGVALATSDNLDVSTLLSYFDWKTINFSGSNRIALTNGTKYVITIEYSGGDASNYVEIEQDIIDGCSGNEVAKISGAWTEFFGGFGVDLFFDLKGSSPATIDNSVSFTIGNSIPLTITGSGVEYLRALTYVNGTLIKTQDLGQVTSATLTYSGGEISNMYAEIPNATSCSMYIRLQSFTDSGYTIQLGSNQDKSGTASIDLVANKPTFTTWTLTNVDKSIANTDIHGNLLVTSSTSTLMGSDDRTAIKGYSKSRATITVANKMVALNSATGNFYAFWTNTQSNTGAYSAGSTVNIDIDNVDVTGNGAILAYDSRNLYTQVNVAYLLINHYTDVSLSALTLARTNAVEQPVNLSLSGEYWKKYFGSDSTTPAGIQNTLTAHYRWKRTNHEWEELDGTATMTIASPCIVTKATHGFETGDVCYFTTSGALPTGLSVDTNYFVIKIDADTFNLATSKVNAEAGTKITTTGTQSGVHTIYGDSVWTTLSLTDTDGSLSFDDFINGDFGASGFDEDLSFNVEVRIFDKLTNIIVEGSIPVGTPIQDWYRSGGIVGVGIGQKYDPLTSDASMLQVAGRVTAVDPVNPQDLVTIKYLQESASFTYTYYTHASSVMSTILTESSTADDETLNATPVDTMTLFYKTSVGDTPTPFTLTAGTLIEFHFDANINSNGRKPTTLQFALFYVDSDGTSNKTAIGDISDATETLTTTQTHYELHAHIATSTTVPAGKRLWVELYANTTGALPYPIVSIYRDSIDYHIAFSIAGSVLNNFVQKSTIALPRGIVNNYQLVPSVASNNLTCTIKTLAGNDPSALDPIYFNIGSVIVKLSSALSVTVTAGTSIFAAGDAVLAGVSLDLYVYIGYNATDGITLGLSRINWAKRYDDFSTTSTVQSYAKISNIANAAAGDEYTIIGRINGSNSGTPSYNWTTGVPNSRTVLNYPTVESRLLAFLPNHTRSGGAYTNAPTNVISNYMFVGERKIAIFQHHTQHATPGSSGNQRFSLPFSASTSASQVGLNGFNSNTATLGNWFIGTGANFAAYWRYDANAECTASNAYQCTGFYFV